MAASTATGSRISIPCQKKVGLRDVRETAMCVLYVPSLRARQAAVVTVLQNFRRQSPPADVSVCQRLPR
jgi:hypothetical protein